MIKNNNFLLFNDSLVLGYYFFAIIKKIQEVLGHSRIETPQIYTHIYNKNVEKAMLEHPLSKYIHINKFLQLKQNKSIIKQILIIPI